MATVPSTADQASDLLQKLSLDSQTKVHDANEIKKKSSTAGGGDASNMSIPPRDLSITPLLQEAMDPNACYFPSGYGSSPYYYPHQGYDGSSNEWMDDYSRYFNQDGLDLPHGVYGDMYHHGYGFSYGSAVPAMGHDGQLYSPQHYQYPSYYQPHYSSNQMSASQPEASPVVTADQATLSSDSNKGNANGVSSGNAKGSNGSASFRSSHQNPSLTSNGSYSRGTLSGGPASAYQDPRYGYDGMRSHVPWFDSSAFSSGQHQPVTATSSSSTVSQKHSTSAARNQNNLPSPHMGVHGHRATSAMGPTTSFINRMYPNNRMYSQYGSIYGTSVGYGANGYGSRTNGRWGPAWDNKYKSRGRINGFYGYSSENHDGLGELNRGPRFGRFKNQKSFEAPVTITVKGQTLQSDDKENSYVIPDKDQFNRADFPDNYADAKFFIIKSYSEDDVHKSVKYNVWASTPNGNKKLDAAYKEAQEKGTGCPIFLFFSVNTSGQFVGVAEMIGPVDFEKNVEFWQQDKWTGCFPLKWHIVKDVPNSHLKHIILENNDNKPVTNSRDTQEVKFDQGLQMLKLFKEYVNKTSILDDFAFYEKRQKSILEKRAKQQSQKQDANAIFDAKQSVNENGIGEQRPTGHPVTANGDSLKVGKLTAEKQAVANGVCSG